MADLLSLLLFLGILNWGSLVRERRKLLVLLIFFINCKKSHLMLRPFKVS